MWCVLAARVAAGVQVLRGDGEVGLLEEDAVAIAHGLRRGKGPAGAARALITDAPHGNAVGLKRDTWRNELAINKRTVHTALERTQLVLESKLAGRATLLPSKVLRGRAGPPCVRW